ncbi:MAG: chondroitinase-B domain-containing protein [Ferruginibacter sp.]
MKKKLLYKIFLQSFFFFLLTENAIALNYTVTTKTELLTRITAALPGDTVFVANGSYDWGQINFTNNNGSSSSAWIVLKAQTLNGVVFTGSTYMQFKGTRLCINGFRFANGNSGGTAVMQFRNSSNSYSNYCRLTNITFDNYNSDDLTENEWVGIYGTYNRVDHCTFINKSNPRATVVVWYSSTTYPAPATSTFHLIDSNYFNGRSYMGSNGGETMRIGDSNSSRTKGFNTIEYNLFENCTQVEPEIVSNKSQYNTYRYNTFKNNHGGLTLRHGRYCTVYGNFFIVDDPNVTEAYGIRAIDKGHKIFNNYIEAVNGNQSGGTSQLRAPINLYNGVTTDTTDATYASQYFAADSCIVAFNTIVNAKGGGGIILGGTGGGTVQPTGIQLANNLIKMSSGTAVYLNPANTSLTFSAEGNIYQAPSGLGGIAAAGWTSSTLNFGSRNNGILTAPSTVQDAAINPAAYSFLLNGIDAQGQTRSAAYDVGCDELNGTGSVLYYPLDSNLVGAGKPSSIIVVPVHLLDFNAVQINKNIRLNWKVENEISFKAYEIQWSQDGIHFTTLASIAAKGISTAAVYSYLHNNPSRGVNYYRLKMIDLDGTYQYSSIKKIIQAGNVSVSVYPNPVVSLFTVDAENIVSKKTILVIDASGRTVSRIETSAGQISIDAKKFTAGLYLLQVIAENKTVGKCSLSIIK